MMKELNRQTYQKLLNDYAVNHERQTAMDCHHQVKAAILDAYDNGIIKHDPTHRAIIKVKNSKKKTKFLSEFELKLLVREPILRNKLSINPISKIKLRFAKALRITPNGFNFVEQILLVNKI